jgi:hypothetical protein
MSLPDLSGTPRTELGRHRERGRTDREDLYAVLDAVLRPGIEAPPHITKRGELTQLGSCRSAGNAPQARP